MLAEVLAWKLELKEVPPVSLVLHVTHNSKEIQLLQNYLIKYKFLVALINIHFLYFLGDFWLSF